MDRRKGFTLIELIIVLFIAAIALAFAVPSFQDMIERNRVRSTTDDLTELLRMARVVSVEQKTPVTVCGSSDQSTCDADWNSSILAVRDATDSSPREIIAAMTVSNKVSITKNNADSAEINFSRTGWAPGDATSFFVCPEEGSQDNAYSVVIALSGRVSKRASEEDATYCQ